MRKVLIAEGHGRVSALLEDYLRTVWNVCPVVCRPSVSKDAIELGRIIQAVVDVMDMSTIELHGLVASWKKIGGQRLVLTYTEHHPGLCSVSQVAGVVPMRKPFDLHELGCAIAASCGSTSS